MVCFFITSICKCILRLETLALINRIIQLGICVTHFPCINEKLKTLYLVWIRRFLLSQRRNLNWVIHNKCRLNQLFLTIFFEEEIDNIAFLVTLLILDMMLSGKLLGSFIICNLVKVNSCIFLDRIIHGQTLKWLSKINLDTIVRNLGGTADLLCQIAEHGFRKFHHSFIICICLVKLHQCKFWIVTGINTLITEYTANLVDSFKSTND